MSSHENRDSPLFGIIGGSGICKLPELKVIETISRPSTKYGPASDDIFIGEYGKQLVAFLPRHGAGHTLPPHRVPYKANLVALKELGVRNVLATCIVGSLKKDIAPGTIVFPDQFVNLTWGRDDHFDVEGSFVHLPMAVPYCQTLRDSCFRACEILDVPRRSTGTVAVIQGPRFSTIAESKWLIQNGWDIVNMTQYPECYFSRELGMCYVAIAAVTDYDVGTGECLSMQMDNMPTVLSIFRKNIEVTQSILRTVLQTAGGTPCNCAAVVTEPYYKDQTD